MAVLSWLRTKEIFMRQNAADELKQFAAGEVERLRNVEADFDEPLYQQAIDLIVEKLEHMEVHTS